MSSMIDQLKVLAQSDPSRCMSLMRSVCQYVLRDPETAGQICGSMSLDKICIDLSKKLPSIEVAGTAKPFVFVVSEIYQTGGHTRVIECIIESLGPQNCLVLSTNLYNRQTLATLNWFTQRTGADLRICEAADFLDKSAWIRAYITKDGISNIYIVSHHDDVGAIAACYTPECLERTLYLHHADHQLAFGATIQDWRHVDFGVQIFDYCRRELGINNEIWHMGVPDKGVVDLVYQPVTARRSVTCGSQTKFALAGRLRFSDVIVAVIASTGGTHVHVGTLPANELAELTRKLQEAGLSPDRFKHVPFTPNLAQFIIDNRIGLYIGSFPHGGGRATIEALSVGVPILTHQSDYSRLLSACDIMFDGAPFWSTIAELEDTLESLLEDPDALVELGKRGRNLFERRHRAELFTRVAKGENWESVFGSMPGVKSLRRDSFAEYAEKKNLRIGN
jgi:glycosyltransferase involved in cell wall biosynthesis